MTLRTRNRLFLLLFAISSLLGIFYLLLILTSIFSGRITPPVNPVRTSKLFESAVLFKYSFKASFLSIIFFTLAAPVMALTVYQEFNKTSSTEILFFAGIIISLMFESLRIFIPILGLWNSFSSLLVFIGRSIVFARVLSAMSLFFSIIFGEADERENESRNFLILLVSAISISMLFPINTTTILSNCTVSWGFKKLLITIRFFLILTTIGCILIQGISNGIRQIYIKLAGIIAMWFGYHLICIADCFIVLIPGIIAITAGSFVYLRAIHIIENSWR